MDDRLTRQTVINFGIVSKPFQIAFEFILICTNLFLFVLGFINWRKLEEKRLCIRKEIWEIVDQIQCVTNDSDKQFLELDIERLEMQEYVPASTHLGVEFGKWLNYQLHPLEYNPEDD